MIRHTCRCGKKLTITDETPSQYNSYQFKNMTHEEPECTWFTNVKATDSGVSTRSESLIRE